MVVTSHKTNTLCYFHSMTEGGSHEEERFSRTFNKQDTFYTFITVQSAFITSSCISLPEGSEMTCIRQIFSNRPRRLFGAAFASCRRLHAERVGTFNLLNVFYFNIATIVHCVN